MCSSDLEGARIIARPCIGKPGAFSRARHRHDYAITPPEENLLVYMKDNGLDVMGVGKIEDIFNKLGITYAVHTSSNEDGIEQTLKLMKEKNEGLIFANLVDFDMKWGHRNDPEAYGKGL